MLLLATVAQAYPPAPDHTFYGMVRNEWGDPLEVSGAKVFIVSTNGVAATASVAASTEPGVNYRLTAPMDSDRSLKTDLTSAGSLRENQAFQLKVQIGAITYLPIEMVVSAPIGEPAGNTRLDLTLGVDSDGDGLPDAWEIANGLNPNDPNDADGDADGDGLSNRNEYLAGTFPLDPNDGFRLSSIGVIDGSTALEFLAISGRTYTVQASSDLEEWKQVNFRVVSGGQAGALQDRYIANDIRTLRIEVPSQPAMPHRIFRALFQ